MMNKNALLTTDTLKQVKNPNLRRNLATMLKAAETGKAATWIYTKALADICKKESFKDDFGTKAAFAAYCDLSTGALSQATAAVDFVEKRFLVPMIEQKDGSKKAEFKLVNIPVATAYLFSTLKDEYDDFVEYCFVHEKIDDVTTLSQNKVKTLIKKWREAQEDANVVSEQDAKEVEIDGNGRSKNEAKTAEKALEEINSHEFTVDEAEIICAFLISKYHLDDTNIAKRIENAKSNGGKFTR